MGPLPAAAGLAEDAAWGLTKAALHQRSDLGFSPSPAGATPLPGTLMPLLPSLRGSPQPQVPVFKERAQLLRTGITQLTALKSEGTGNELLGFFPPFWTHFQPAPPARVCTAPAAEEGQPHRGAFAWLEKQMKLCKHVSLIPSQSQIMQPLGAVADTQLEVPSCTLCDLFANCHNRNSSSYLLLHQTEGTRTSARCGTISSPHPPS